METGFNFRTHQVEKMENYKVLNYFFDYEKEFLDQTLNKGADNLEHFFSTIALQLEPNENYHIMLKITNSEYLEYEEYFTLFSTFAFCLTQLVKGIDNKQGYLKVKPELQKHVIITDYTLLKIMNNDYPYGTIQMTIEDDKETLVTWTNLRDLS